MLAIEGLTVNYGAVSALREVTLNIREGEVVGLIGPNGAGKSTTLNAIAGVVRPTRGDIRYLGKATVGLSPEQLVRDGIALVPEGRRIFGTLTVVENLRLGATTRRDRSAVNQELTKVFERFPVLERYAKTHADRLSGGEQQQLAFARALLSKPRLLLLDEPSLGLAPLMIDLVFDTLQTLREEGVTILLVEQAAARTAAFADRSYVLNTGRVVLSGTRDELAREANFAEAYLGGLT